MKLALASFFTGICLAISAFPAVPANSTSSTGFSLFHVEVTGPAYPGDPYTCLTEANGAVVNNCTYDVSLEFNLPISTWDDYHTITVQDYWQWASGTTRFYCQAYAYNGAQGSAVTLTPEYFFTAASETNTLSLFVPTSGDTMQLICWNVPPGDGIASINWTF